MKLDIEAELKRIDQETFICGDNTNETLKLAEALTRLKRIGQCAVMIKTDPLWAQSMAYAEILRLCGVEKP